MEERSPYRNVRVMGSCTIDKIHVY
jgi:hypothetical protein